MGNVEGLVYKAADPISRGAAIQILENGPIDRIPLTLVRLAFHDPDLAWVQAQCVQFSIHGDSNARGVSATCIGHLARIHGKLEGDAGMLAVTELLNDKDETVRGQAADALEDIQLFANEKGNAE